jgi:hypothetical protein
VFDEQLCKMLDTEQLASRTLVICGSVRVKDEAIATASKGSEKPMPRTGPPASSFSMSPLARTTRGGG